MNNAKAIKHAVELARSANWLAISHTRTGNPAIGNVWRQRRDHHMSTARQLRDDQ
jgi:hypothetical protein